jgi:hypothetical protein
MDSHKRFDMSASRRPTRIALSGYRVIAGFRDRSEALVTLATTLRQAINSAKEFYEAAIASYRQPASNDNHRKDRLAEVRVEEWVGTLTEGQWERVRYGGFMHRFNTRSHPNGDHRRPSLPESGSKVECVLLPEKTRKGGWKAKLLQGGLEGSITNTSDVPKSAKPDQKVTLRVGAISHGGKRIQFHWHVGDNPGCR